MTEEVSSCIASLRAQLLAELPKARPSPHGGLYTISIPLELSCPPLAGPLAAPFFIWARPSEGHVRIASGIALRLEASGAGRFGRLQRDFARFAQHWQQQSLGEEVPPPGAFCICAFEDESQMTGPWAGLPSNLLVVPEVVLEARQGRYRLSLSCTSAALADLEGQQAAWIRRSRELLDALQDGPPPAGGNTLQSATCEPPDGPWLALAEAARQHIRQGRLDKLVLARHLQVQASHGFQPAGVVRQLVEDHPSCLVLGMSLGGPSLVAASPERLVSLRQGQLRCDALGGTGASPSAAGQDEGEPLLQDPKVLHEHQLVVDHLRQSLAAIAPDLSIPAHPSLMPLGRLQHLRTQIQGSCGDRLGVMQLAALIHPSPAVAGMPVAEARAWLAEHEPFERGWYSGCVGWLEANGDGEVAVVLRCALLNGQRADLYAGAGIVAASDPQAELEEIALKLASVLDALAAG